MLTRPIITLKNDARIDSFIRAAEALSAIAILAAIKAVLATFLNAGSAKEPLFANLAYFAGISTFLRRFSSEQLLPFAQFSPNFGSVFQQRIARFADSTEDDCFPVPLLTLFRAVNRIT